MEKIVLVGFGSAGFAALSTFKRLGCRDEIVIIDNKEHDLLHPCGLPYALEGLADEEKLYHDIGLERMGVKVIRTKALSIDTVRKSVKTDLRDHSEVPYDKLLIATGSSPVIPPVEGCEQFLGKGIFTLTDTKDLENLRNNLTGKNSAIVIGAGAIGLESAVALKTHVAKVTVIEMKDQVLPGVLDPDMASIVTDYLIQNGIGIVLSHTVEKILGDGAVEGVRIAGSVVEGQIAILAAGFRPNSDIVKNSGINIERSGICTDKYLRTNIKDIFVAGDCSAKRSVIDGKTIGAKLATSSYKQGVIAACNIMGLDKEYLGSAGTFVTKIGELEIAGTGFTTSTAKERGFDPVISKISSNICPEYFNRKDEIVIKIVADRLSGRILGAQCIGKNGAASRVNIISAALEYNLNLEELERLELAYCPAVSEVFDPLLRAVDGASRRIKR
jgi:NADH oxidase (H2O2-forming)